MDKADRAGNHPRRILLIYRRMIPSIRLCGHCQMEEMAAEGKAEYRAVQEMRLKAEDLRWAETVLLGRLDSWYELQLVKRLHGAGKYLIYIMDDDLFHIPPEVTSASYYNQKAIQRYIREILETSDAVMSPSPVLLEKYAVNGRKAIRIEEPAIAPAPWEPRSPGAPVKIGFAGSVDRMGDLEGILKESLLQIRREYGNRAEFEFFGANPSFAGELGARWIPYTESYDQYRTTLQGLRWDIGLAPMPDTPFHACKHYNKFVEYAAAGIAGIYSEVGPYRRLDAFPGCAVMCPNRAEAWTAALRRLLEDDGAREEMRKKASECARRELSVKASGESILREAEGGKAGGSFGPLAPLKAVNLVKRTVTSLRGHGPLGFVKHAVSLMRAK